MRHDSGCAVKRNRGLLGELPVDSALDSRLGVHRELCCVAALAMAGSAVETHAGGPLLDVAVSAVVASPGASIRCCISSGGSPPQPLLVAVQTVVWHISVRMCRRMQTVMSYAVLLLTGTLGGPRAWRM
jgi:hypothetical protein